MNKNLTEGELREAQDIQERLDTVRLRIEHAVEKEIAAGEDFSHLANTLSDIKYWIDEIDLDARLLVERIDRRQWEEWNEGK